MAFCALSLQLELHAQQSPPYLQGTETQRFLNQPVNEFRNVQNQPPNLPWQNKIRIAQVSQRGTFEPKDSTGSASMARASQDGPQYRLPLLAPISPHLNPPPQDPQVKKAYSKFVPQIIDPEMTLDVMVGRPRILVFSQTPMRVYMVDHSIASHEVITDKEIAIVGEKPGHTVLTIWIDDEDAVGPEKTKVLSYLIRVARDPELKSRLDKIYKGLEAEINAQFLDSRVRLSLVGDQLLVQGEAKDIIQAEQIMRVVNEHAPPSRRKQEKNFSHQITFNQTNFTEQQTVRNLQQSAEQMELLRLAGQPNVINMLKIPGPQQVMLRVTVAEVNRSALRSLGTRLSIEGGGGFGVNSAFPESNLFLDATSALLLAEGGTFSLLRGDLRLAINALKQHRLAKTLAEPTLVTLHGRAAQFQAGGQFPVPAAEVGFGTSGQGVQFVPFGVQLQFVPYITDRDKIRLEIAADVSTRDDAQATSVSGSNVPGLSTRNFSNSVELRTGQTLAVAGLIQSNFGADNSRVPLLGDTPFLGRLFASDATSADEQELIILITPELVSPIPAEVEFSLPGSDMFDPSNIEFFLQGRLESLRTDGFRSPVRHDKDRICRYRTCQDTYIMGPVGYSMKLPEVILEEIPDISSHSVLK
ncbi:MAG: pilus assembly protein N-terminal domain-containing protein [Pirellulaceae bacterium]|nr:pilus assembly protein N-terminal domain-containing protein [Pirellulaceae bacterium]